MNNFRRRALLSVSSGETGRIMIGNYEVVDLGLPSRLLFATCNVGATDETKYGNYYQWGAGVVTYNNENQYHTSGTNTNYTLPSSADTATQVMGSGWRMPKQRELQELINNTDYEWVTNFNGSGINGGKFTSRKNPNAYVFFPAAGLYSKGKCYYKNDHGYFWSSTPNGSSGGHYLAVGSNDALMAYNGRNTGVSVRGVHAAV